MPSQSVRCFFPEPDLGELDPNVREESTAADREPNGCAQIVPSGGNRPPTLTIDGSAAPAPLVAFPGMR